MPLFSHKENRDINATSPANNAYANDGTIAGNHQTGGLGSRNVNDGYDPAYDNTRTTGALGANEPYGNHGTNTTTGTGFNNTTGNAYNDNTYGNQPGVGHTGMTGNRFNEPTSNAYNDGAQGTNTHTGGLTGVGRNVNDGTYGTNTNTGVTGTGLHNQSTAQPNTLDTTNPNTGVVGGQQTSAYPSDREARHLERSGKIEKAIGTVLCSTTMKQKGMQKQVEGANIAMQSHQLGQAEQLEAQAKAMRGNAVGMGAHPNHLNPGNAQGTTGGQYGNTY